MNSNVKDTLAILEELMEQMERELEAGGVQHLPMPVGIEQLRRERDEAVGSMVTLMEDVQEMSVHGRDCKRWLEGLAHTTAADCDCGLMKNLPERAQVALARLAEHDQTVEAVHDYFLGKCSPMDEFKLVLKLYGPGPMPDHPKREPPGSRYPCRLGLHSSWEAKDFWYCSVHGQVGPDVTTETILKAARERAVAKEARK